MLFASLLRAVIASICLGPSMAQKVTQAQPEISVVEKESVTLDCVYETRDPTYYLFWYKQPPSGEMIFLIRQDSFNEKNETKDRYFLNLQKSTSSISLTITASQLMDSAVYFCALREATERRVPVGALQKPQQEIGPLGRDSITDRKKQGLWRSNGDSVTQTEGTVTLPEGAPVILNCTYETTYSVSYLFCKKDLNAKIVDASHKKDPYLSVCLKSVRGIKVEQSPPDLSLREGASSMLWCNFSAASSTVQWFRQNLGGRLINLFYIPSGTKQIGRLTATTVTKERHSSLYISSSQITDAAIYFCAVEPQHSPGTCSLYTNPRQDSAPPPDTSTSQGHYHSIFTASYSLPTLAEF
ncbi:PREDICTED: uncharacterized protein LOC105814163 [Propithecus coquereli]|uniref:uncharacterized protein LOC105814163 n=1 Tax=Propithecus coquereli TaxID=379532 RepID=UPI00063F67B7|nr:PREDICTED: uncharacterized protein LOC105814163 [Propithecus coquereli]